jgi:hypothetical protein
MQASMLKTFYTLTEEDGILIAHVSKRVSVAEFKELSLDMVQKARKKNINKLLAEGLSVDFGDLTTLERHDIGVAAAEILKGEFKAVAVIQKQFINKHGENVANNRGADVLVTDSMDEAIRWLLK